MNEKKNYAEIRRLIEKDKLEDAIELLKSHIMDHDLRNDLILQSAQLSQLNKLTRNDVISFEQAVLSKNKIRIALIQVTAELEAGHNGIESKFLLTTKMVTYLLILAILSVATVFIFAYQSGYFTPTPLNQAAVDETKLNASTAGIIFAPDTLLKTKSLETKRNEPVNVKEQVTPKIENNATSSDTESPVIEGQVLDNEGKGIEQVSIQTADNTSAQTNKIGLFRLALPKTIDQYPLHIYLYFTKDSLQGKELVRVGQKNVILRFKSN